MLKWIRTAIAANRDRRRAEMTEVVKRELAESLQSLPDKVQSELVKSVLSASEIPRELIESLIRTAQSDCLVEVIFRDGSTMRIMGTATTKRGPGG